MKPTVVLLILTLLTACGADGAPVPPGQMDSPVLEIEE